MNTAPSTNLLYSLKESRMTWDEIIAELVDNSLDAGATRITIEWSKGEFRVTDDGHGLPATEFASFMRLGEHRPGRRKKTLGRYGVGLKESCGRLWGFTRIVSTCAGERATIRVDWNAWAQSENWDLTDPLITHAEGTGTEIVCSHFKYRAPHPEAFDRLVREVSFVFSPALRQGIQIQFLLGGRRRLARRYEMPARTDVIEGTLVVDGKSLTINVGIVPEGVKNDRSGLHYYYGHRLILPSSSLGCGTFNTSRIFGWVELDHKWQLGKHKDEITDEARDQLASAVELFCARVLLKAGQIADVIRLEELDLAATDALRADLDAFVKRREDKARRAPEGDQAGTIEPRHSGRRHNDAETRQAGESLLPKKVRGELRIQHGELADEQGLGYFDKEARVIKINTAHPIVRHLIASQRVTGFGGTHQLAITLLVQQAAIDESVRSMLPFMDLIAVETRRFSVALGAIMQRWIPAEAGVSV